MPYIRKEARDDLDDSIETLQLDLRDTPRKKRKAALNYVVSRLALAAFGANRTGTQRGILAPQNHHDISDAISALRDAADEITRRLMGPRENYAIGVFGDLPEYFEDKFHE